MYVFEHFHILAERLLKSVSSIVCPSVVRFTDSAQYVWAAMYIPASLLLSDCWSPVTAYEDDHSLPQASRI